VSASRTERLSEQIKAEASDVLARDVHDPGVGFVTITRVRVSPDLQVAHIYYTGLGDTAAQRATEKALERVTPFVRRQLAQRRRQDPQAQPRRERRAQRRRHLVAPPRAHRLRDEHVRRAQQPEREADQHEREQPTQRHPRQLRAPDVPDQQGVGQRHQAVGDGRGRDRPRQPHQLGQWFLFPGQRRHVESQSERVENKGGK